jgi:hypothetical protein
MIVTAAGRTPSWTHCLLAEQEFLLEEEAELGDLLIVCNTTNTSYKKAVERKEEWLADFKCRPVCGEMLGSWAETASATLENEENEANKLQELPNKKEEKERRERSLRVSRNGLAKQMKESGSSRGGRTMATRP